MENEIDALWILSEILILIHVTWKTKDQICSWLPNNQTKQSLLFLAPTTTEEFATLYNYFSKPQMCSS